MKCLNHLKPKYITDSLCKIRQNLRATHHSNEGILVRIPIIILVTTQRPRKRLQLTQEY